MNASGGLLHRRTLPEYRKLLHAPAAVLIGMPLLTLEPTVIGSRTLAQQASSLPSPPADSPALRTGQQILRPWGPVEITALTRTQTDQNTKFKLEFLIRNESASGASFSIDHFRIIADGVPRAPNDYSVYSQSVSAESAVDGWVTFDLPGHPRVVYLQWGIGDEGRQYLRWPE